MDLSKRYSRKTDLIEIVQEILDEQYKITAFTNPECPVITPHQEVQLAKWGLIPAWVKSGEEAMKFRKMNLNARSETVFDLPSFRTPIRTRRCMIPSTGYFEFQHDGKKVVPFYIFLRDETVFSLGGMIEWWQNPITKAVEQTFTVLTTSANSLCASIHNGGKNPFRMPIIIKRDHEERWLDNSLKINDIKDFFIPFDAERMNAYPIAGDFMKRNPKDPTIIEPAA